MQPSFFLWPPGLFNYLVTPHTHEKEEEKRRRRRKEEEGGGRSVQSISRTGPHAGRSTKTDRAAAAAGSAAAAAAAAGG